MSRRAADREDPHARFSAWLLDGADGDLPRDVLVHAAYCDACRRTVAALDALALVDLGSAPMPATLQAPAPARRAAPAVAARILATGGLVVAVSGAVVAGTGALPAMLGPTDTPVQQVLGGTGRPSPTLAPSPTPTPTPNASEAPR